MDKELAAHIAANPVLAEKGERMPWLKGVGPILAAARSNPILKAFYQRLKTKKGKPHKVAIVAVMRRY